MAQAQANLSLRQRERDRAGRALEVLLGRYPDDSIALVEDLPIIKRTIPAGLPADLLHRRPDIRAAERRFSGAQERILEARKAFLPTIQLTGNLGTHSDELYDLLDSSFSIWSIAGGLVQPFFQGHRLSGELARSKAAAVETVANYGQTALQAFREVETALGAEHFLLDQLKHISAAKKEAAAAETLSWQQYRRGLTSMVTVLESQRRAFNASSQLLSIRNQCLQNRISLYLALGGDFDTPEDTQKND